MNTDYMTNAISPKHYYNLQSDWIWTEDTAARVLQETNLDRRWLSCSLSPTRYL